MFLSVVEVFCFFFDIVLCWNLFYDYLVNLSLGIDLY